MSEEHESQSSQPSTTDAQTQKATRTKTQWHQLLGTLFELVLSALGVSILTEFPVMSEPPKVDIVLLRRDDPRWTPSQLRFLPDGIRDTQVKHILIEFKYTESLTEDVLRQIVTYDYLYGQSKAPQKDVQSFIMSARTPRASFLTRYGYTVTDLPGIYRSENPLLARIPIIVLNELRDEPHNAFVQCFASRRRIRERAFKRLQEIDFRVMSEAFWAFILGLQSQMAQRGGKMEQVITQDVITPESVMEIGKQMRAAIVRTLTLEERLAGLEPEERLAGLEPEERLAGLEPGEAARLLSRLEAYLREQQAAVQSANDDD